MYQTCRQCLLAAVPHFEPLHKRQLLPGERQRVLSLRFWRGGRAELAAVVHTPPLRPAAQARKSSKMTRPAQGEEFG